MNINDVSAILKLDKSLREDVRKAERQRDEIDSHITESVKELRDSRYAKLGCVDESRILGRVLLRIIPGRQTNEEGDVVGGRELRRIGAVA